MTTEPFIGEISILPYTFVPRDYAPCKGQALSIAQNQALFAIIGTYFGGDGQATFAVPNLAGRAPMHWGAGPGLTYHNIGDSGGTAAVTLVDDQMPSHSHSWRVIGEANPNNDQQPTYSMGLGKAEDADGKPAIYLYKGDGTPANTPTPDTPFNAAAISDSGGGTAHSNMQPFLGMSFFMAMVGIFPSRG